MTSDRAHYTQLGRMMAVETRLGEDTLLLQHLVVDERINALFSIEASAKSQRDDLDPGDLIGSTVDFRLHLKDGGTRWWNGFVTHMHEGKLTTRGTRSYGFIVRPKLWLLSQRSDCRIFQNQTTPQIIETLLQEHGISEYQMRLTSKIAPQVYSVQWNETDLDYMLRRMQQDGLFYWHDFKRGRHILVVGDHHSAYRATQYADVRYSEGSPAQDHISSWTRSFAFTPGRRTGRDWNFETMQAPSGEQRTFAQVPGNADHELYEFPGRFLDSMAAEQAMKYRIQATESGFETVEAISTVRTLAPGQTFTPTDVAKPDNRFDSQVVVAIRHVADDPTYETGGGQPAYDNILNVMPATTPATPHRFQRRPRINGQQIALIAGPPGEEIFCDQFGRVKVWFPWDRRATKDGSDTCWIRVGQPWAGGKWGYQTIPRVGMEALISYQEGDPDRPFVTALVPDATNQVPYELPTNKTRTVIKTNSYKSYGYNEIRLEDATKLEEIFTHAQRDRNTVVENDETLKVGQDCIHRIAGNDLHQVEGFHIEEIVKSHLMKVGGDLTQIIGGEQDLLPAALPIASADQTYLYLKDHQIYHNRTPDLSEGNYTINVKGTMSEYVGSNFRLEATEGIAISSNSELLNFSIEDMNLASQASIYVSAIETLALLATEQVVLKCGGASITLSKDGNVAIKGTKIKLNDPEGGGQDG